MTTDGAKNSLNARGPLNAITFVCIKRIFVLKGYLFSAFALKENIWWSYKTPDCSQTDLKLLFWARLGFSACQFLCKEAEITYLYECASRSFVRVFVCLMNIDNPNIETQFFNFQEYGIINFCILQA